MPFILEGIWLLLKLWFTGYIIAENRRQKFSDPQLRAIKEHGVGYQALQDGRLADALEAFTQAIHQNKPGKDIAHWLRAETRYKLGSYQLAIEDCEASLSIQINNSQVYHLRAKCLFQLTDYAKAFQNTEYALRLNQANPEVFILQANCLAELGKATEATEQKALAKQLLVQNT